jgi:hypothetical protein
MSRDELVERFTLERVGASPAVFDFQKLDWLNGVYLRELAPDEYADRIVGFLREQGYDWDETLVRKAAPLVQEKIATLGEFPAFARFFLRAVPRRSRLRTAPSCQLRRRRSRGSSRSMRGRSRRRYGSCDRLGSSPVRRFHPSSCGTGSNISPASSRASSSWAGAESIARNQRPRQRLRRSQRVERAR